jgi:hypothetical protein
MAGGATLPAVGLPADGQTVAGGKPGGGGSRCWWLCRKGAAVTLLLLEGCERLPEGDGPAVA